MDRRAIGARIARPFEERRLIDRLDLAFSKADRFLIRGGGPKENPQHASVPFQVRENHRVHVEKHNPNLVQRQVALVHEVGVKGHEHVERPLRPSQELVIIEGRPSPIRSGFNLAEGKLVSKPGGELVVQ